MIKTLRRMAFGFPLGIIIGSLIAVIFSYSEHGEIILYSSSLPERFGSEGAAMFAHIILSGLLGAVSFAGIGFYDIESKRWNLAAASVSHYLTIVLTYIPIALCLDWIATAADALIMAGIQAVAYFIIWLIMSLIYKAQVKELNEINSKKTHSKDRQGGSKKTCDY